MSSTEAKRTLYHIGVSGGKDSTAVLLWAIHESGIPRDSLRVSFCDTVNEDDITYAHIRLLNDVVVLPAGISGGIETLHPELGFFQLALKKHRFPSRKAQFCTQFLKIEPTRRWLEARWAEGFETVVINGKRSGESVERGMSMKGKPERAFSDFWGCEEWSPIQAWSLDDVLAIHSRHKIPLNPLYAMGANRVGCFPCINCGKEEIRMVAKFRPEKVAQIAEWERKFEEVYGRPSTFFASKVTTKRYRTKKYTDDDGKVHMIAPIDQVVRWAQTVRGGEQLRLDMDEPKACFAKYRACE